MKKIGEYTVRGQFDTSLSDMERITLFDGRFDTAYRVVKMQVCQRDRLENSAEAASVKLATDPTGNNNRTWEFQNNQEIAWAICNADANSASVTSPDPIIDPDNMIVEDLYIGGYSYSDTEKVNYIITLHKYYISDWKGELTMVRNRSQA